MRVFKGYKNVVLTREFFAASLSDPFAAALYDYVKDTRAVEEHFYPTLGSVRIGSPDGGGRIPVTQLLTRHR